VVRRVFFGLALAVIIALCGFGFIRTAVKKPIILGVVAAIVAAGFAAAWVAAARRRARFAAGGNVAVAKRVARGDGLPLDALAKRLGKSADELRAFTPTYREARIPKRRGGERRLLIPDEATKALQRKLLREVLFGLRAHPAATGFERGKSIVDNALPHVGRAVVIRMDVVDFFPSTKTERVLRYFQWIGWNREAAEALTKLTTWDGGLPQGAPTSPRLSNLVNRYLDVQIANRVARRGGGYTRYADDITISLPRPNGRRVRGIVQFTRRMLKKRGYALHVKRKLHVARRHQRQAVTGLVVNERVRLPREIRRRLRATAHRIEKGLEPLQGIDAAQGWFAYARMVERQAGEKAPPPGGAA
jgi:RNA-directed DNA polymerase